MRGLCMMAVVAWLPAQALAAEVRLDLGPLDGSVLDGFTEVAPSSSSGVASVSGKARSVGSLGYPDPLISDGIRGGVLHLDIPAGTYQVAALFEDVRWVLRPVGGRRSGLVRGERWIASDTTPEGDALFGSRFYGALPRPHFADGSSAWDRQVAPRYLWRMDTLTVEGDGGVDLEIRGMPLSALVLTDADRATLEVELALIDAKREAWFLEHHPPVEQSVAVAGQGLIGVEPLAWDEVPANPANPRPVDSIEVMPGQRISRLFAIHGSDEPSELRLEAPPELLPEAFEVTWLDAIESRISRVRPHILHPLGDPSAPPEDGIVVGTVEGGQGLVPLAAWAITVPPDARPGEHTVRIQIGRAGQVISHEVQLRVRRLALEPPASPVGWWADLHGPTAVAYGGDTPQARQIWADAVRLMRSRGATVLGFRGAFFPGDWTDPGGQVPAANLAWGIQTWREAGGGWALWVDPLFSFQRIYMRTQADPPLNEAALELQRDFVAAARENDVVVMITDERVAYYGPGAIPRLGRLFDQLTTLDGPEADGAEFAASVAHSGGSPVLADRVDHVFIQRSHGLYRDRYAWFDGHRAKAWAYNLGVGRDSGGRIPWVLEPEGMLLWHLNGRYNDPYVEDRGAVWQFVIPRPDLGYNLPLRRLERVGEGITDQRVLSTLSALVRELDGHRRSDVQQDVARACALLRAAESSVEGSQPWSMADLELADDAQLDRLRDQAAAVAERLARRSKRQRDLRRRKPVAPVDGHFPSVCRDAER